MDLKREKPELEDIEDRRGRKLPPGVEVKRSFKYAERAEKRAKAQRESREKMIKEIAKSSKDSDEYNRRVSEFEQKLRRNKEEMDQSASDATKAWEEGMSGQKSPEMEKALKEISNTTKSFDKKKIKTPPALASGGTVRGFGRARGAKPVNIR